MSFTNFLFKYYFTSPVLNTNILMVGYGLKESKKTGKCQGKYLSAKSNSQW